MNERLMEIAQAVNTLGDDDFTGAGLPKVEALSDALKKLGFEPTSADERDTAWPELLADAAKAQNPEAASVIVADDMVEPVPDMVDVVVTDSATSPIELSVNGRTFTFYRNTRKTVPDYVVSALRNSDITFTEVSA